MLNEIYNPFDKIITDKEKLVHTIIISIQKNQGILITYLNQHCFNIFQSNEQYREILQTKAEYYYDGFGVYCALKFLKFYNMGKFFVSRVNEELCDYFIKNNVPVIIIGGKFSLEMIKKTKLNVELYLNGFEDLHDKNIMINKVKNCKSKIIIIGAGVPKQEIIGSELIDVIPDLKIICVGNFLEFNLGTVKRAPKILHNSGFEWVHRLITEPKRLWKRYLIGIPTFALVIIRIFIYNKLSSK